MSSAAYRLSSRSTAAATSNHVLHHQSSAGSVITTATANSAPANNPPPSTIKEGGPRSGGGAPPHAAPNDATVGHSSHIENHDQGVAVPSIPSRSCKSPEYQPEYIGKTQLQNSSTMDSGVEDCCEPPPVPSIELDEKLGFRVRVNMAKAEGAGFGFSVVWVSPPRIERLEKDKTADLAGLKIGDLIIGVNGEDVTTVPNTTIYNKMKSTGMELDLEVWRKHPHVASPLPPHITSANVPQPINPAACVQPPVSGASSVPPNSKKSSVTAASADCRDHRPTSTAHNNNCTSTTLPQNSSYNNTNNVKQVATSGLPNTSGGGNGVSGGQNPLINRIQPQPPPPTSILKPPPPAPPVTSSSVVGNSCPSQSQPTTGSSAWRIRFNIELLDNEDDNLKQFFICELKFFRKVVAALDRYLIPAQANRLLTPQEIHLIFAQVIKIITMTKRILQCVANGSNSSTWKLGRILLSTHSDHLPEITSAYTAYARSLGYSAMILSEKMSIQDFAKFVLETPVPKGHLDMTSLLFAPFEHLRNLCEIGEEISHQHDNWIFLNSRLKECYADIVCETDFMEPISHVSMKKNPLLSVRDLEKRIISTTSQQPLKVCEKGRKWLFGSRLYRRENDGSWSPVWAFLFTDIIVLTSHMTRDRVFFVKETPIRLDDVVTLHFNLPKKHENEFRLLFGPDTSHHSRLDRILPLVRSKKPNQVVLRTANMQLKSLWKLLLQRQIISLNTRLSKSSSSNFSISEFCEKFPVVQHDSIMEEDEEKVEVEPTSTNANHVTKLSQSPFPTSRQTAGAQLTHNSSATHPSAAAGRTEKLQLDRFPTRKVQHAIPSSSLPVKSDTGVVGKVPSKTTSHETQQNPPSEMKQPEERVTKECQQNKRNVTVNGAPVSTSVTSPNTIPYVPDGLSSINADLMRVRVVRGGGGDRRLSFPGNGGATSFSPSNALDNEVKSVGDGSDRLNGNLVPDNSTSVIIDEKPIKVDRAVATSLETEKSRNSRPTQHDAATSTQPMPDNLISLNAVGVNYTIPPVPKARTSLSGVNANANSHTPTHSATSRTTTPAPCLDNATATAPSPIPSHNNNNTIDNASEQRKKGDETCPCANKINDKVPVENQMLHAGTGTIRPDGQITAYPSPKPRQLSNLKRLSTGSKEEGTQTPPKQPLPSKPIATSRQNDNSIKTVGNKNTPAIAPVDKAVGIATKSETHNGTVATVRHTYSKETPLERIPEALQSPVMVKRAQALASGTDTPSSSSSLSPARLPRTVKSSNSNSSDTTVNNSNKQAVLENMNSALKESVVNNAMMKSKPGSKIMTNAILKSRQQELIAQNLKTCSVNVSTETLRTEKSSDTTTASTSKTNSSTQYFSLKEESTTTSSCSVQSQTQSQSQQIMVRCVHNKNIIVHHQHHSHHCPGSCCGSGGATVNNLLITSGGGAPASPHLSVPPPRCHSENSHHPKKSKPVHTDSPIISGFGSERARRRMLVDNKLRKDYPELFGITPKDRRSFIKQLGDPDMNSKGLVAPYYYTMSPVPIPKHRMLAVGNSSNSSDVVVGSTHTWKQGNDSEKGNGNRKSSPLVIPPFNPNNSHAKGPTKSNEDNAGASCSAATTSSSAAATKSSIVSGSSKNTQRIEQPTQNPEFLPSLEDAAGSSGNGMSQSFQEPCHAPAAAGETRFQPSGMSTSNQFRSYENDQREISGKLESNRGDEDDDDDDDASGIAAQLAHDVYQASFELDEDGQRLKDFVEKMRAEMSEGGVGMEDDDDDDEEEDEEEEDDDDDEEDSDDSTAGGHEGEHEGQSHRSHEESSNDSGISDEMTEKSKTTMSGLLEEDEDHERSLTLSISRRNENFSNMLDCMRSGVLAAEVKKNPSTNPDKISSNTSTNTPTATVSNSATPHVSSNRVHANNDHTNKAPIVDDDVAGNNVVVVDNNNCCSPNNDHANKTKYNDSSATNHPSHVVCCTNSNKSHVVDGTTLCFLEGETKASMETLVVLKADKATETEDDDFNFLLAMNNRGGDSSTTSTNAHQQIIQMQQHDEKPLRSIMAERREAFFLSQQSSFSNPHCPFTSTISGSGQAAPHGHSIHFAEDFPTYTTRSQFRQQQHSNTHNNHNSCKTGYFSVGNNHNQGVSGCVNCTSDAAHPLKVKIVDGGTLQSVVDTSPNQNSANNAQSQEPCERVQLQRLERHKKAKVERVESSEDSTSSSSDLASASPAAENGTTDPSWSSSSSGSLAGYASSKEEPLIPSTCSTNNATGGSSVAMPPCATVPTSSAPSSSSPSACVVATSTCSQCSNSNNNNSHNNNHLNKDSISSVSSCSASAQTHDEPSSSCHEYENTSSKSYSLLVETDLSSLLVEEEGEETDDHDANAFAASGSSCCFRSSNNNSNILTTSNHDTCATNINNNSNNLETTCSHQATTCATHTSHSHDDMNESGVLAGSSDVNELVENNSEPDSSTSCSSISTTSNSQVPLLAPSNTKGTSTAAGNITCETSTTTSSSFSSKSSFSSSSSTVVLVVSSAEDQSGCQSSGGVAGNSTGPEIVVTQESDPEDCSSHSSNENINTRHGYSSDGEEDSIVCNGKAVDSVASDENGGGSSTGEGGGSGCSSSNRSSKGFLRVESNDSTAENYGDDDDYNFDDDDDEEDDLSHCSVATINRYGTFESLEKLESEDTVGGLPDFHRTMPRSKARFTFEDDDDDDDDLFEEDFETDFNFRFPSQIQDNTYSVSRLGPLPPLLEEDYEDEMYDETRASGVSPSSSSGMGEYSGGIGAGCSSSAASLRARHETGLRRDNSFLLARLATMYARSSISPITKILRELWLKKRYRQWQYKE